MKNRHVLILGRSGTGKSTLLKQVLFSNQFPRLIILDISDEYEGEETSIDTLIDWVLEERTPPQFSCRIVPDTEQDIRHLSTLVLMIGHCVLVAEEMADYAQVEEFKRLLRRGRRQGVQVLGISQRPADIPKTVTSQMPCTVCFWTDEPRDLEYVRQRWGGQAVDELRSLKAAEYEYAVWGNIELWDALIKS